MSRESLPPLTLQKTATRISLSNDGSEMSRSCFDVPGGALRSTGSLRSLHYDRMARLGRQRGQAPAAAPDRLFSAAPGYAGHVPMKETEGLGFGQTWARGCQLARQRRGTSSSLPRLSLPPIVP